LQADFANKFIGGGVIAGGCVQEGEKIKQKYEHEKNKTKIRKTKTNKQTKK